MKRVFAWFKNHFIPHPGNDHRPRFLRHDSMMAVLLLVLIVELSFILQVFLVFNKTKLLATVLPAVLASLTNEERKENNVLPLAENDLLKKAAELKANDMATRGYFSHVTPEGKTPWYWLDQVGYQYSYAGENLAVNFFESGDVAKAWMNSPTHWANVIKKDFTEIGIGVANGKYEGRETVFVVEFFGKPAEKIIARTPSESPSKQLPVKNEPKTITSPTPTPAEIVKPIETKVLGETTVAPAPIQNISKISGLKLFLAKILTSPKMFSNYFFWIIIFLILLALALAAFIRFEIQHSSIIIRGLALIAVIVLLLFSNGKLFHLETKVPAGEIGASAIKALP